MDNFINAFTNIVAMIQSHMMFVLKLLLILWVFNIINWVLLGSRLVQFGIYPRKIPGLIGIIFAPFLHANFNHLFFNSIPLFLLLNFMLVGGINSFYLLSIKMILIGGLIVWLIGRPALHIGASSLVMSYWGYLLANAYQRPTAITIVLAAVTLYYFASLLLNVFPSSEKVSWEGHLAGVIAGIAVAFLPI